MEAQRQYWPVIKGGKIKKRFRFGNYQAMVLSDLKSPGGVKYLYVMRVFRSGGNELCLCIASEENVMYTEDLPGDGTIEAGESHFLGVFPGQGHLNLGTSNDWADLEKFTIKALEVARHHFKVDQEPVEEPVKKPWWRFW